MASANAFGGRTKVATFERLLKPASESDVPLQDRILNVFFGPNGPPPAKA